MQITTEEEYTSFKLKFGYDNLTIEDDEVLKLWILGNEVILTKENTAYYYFLIGLGKPGSADKFREFRLVKYDSGVSRMIEDKIFKTKNSVLTENIDLFDNLFLYFSK